MTDQTPDAGRDALVEEIAEAVQYVLIDLAYPRTRAKIRDGVARAVLPIIDRLVAEARKTGYSEGRRDGMPGDWARARADARASGYADGRQAGGLAALRIAENLIAEHRQWIEDGAR